MLLYVFGGGMTSAVGDMTRVLGHVSLHKPTNSTAFPQVTGQQRMLCDSNWLQELYMPADTQSQNWPVANVSRTWTAAYFDTIWDDTVLCEYVATVGDVDSHDYYRIGSLRFGTSVYRQLRVYGVYNFSTDGEQHAATGGQPSASNDGSGNALLTDTRSAWIVDQWVGRWVLTAVGKFQVTSNDATNLHGTGGWIDSVPTGTPNYTIQSSNYPKIYFKIADNAGTIIGTGTVKTTGVRELTTPTAHILEFRWTPSTVAASNIVDLWVDGVQHINGSTGGTTVDPTTNNPGFSAGQVVVVPKGTAQTLWQGTGIYLWGFYYDNLTAASFTAFPQYSSAPPAASLRPLLSYRPAVSGGSPKYDAWTKTSGTDAGALLDEHPTADDTDYVSSSVVSQQQSWPLATITTADIPVHTYDTIYGVMYVGQPTGSNSAAKPTIFQTDGTTDDTGFSPSTSWGTELGPFYYMAVTSPTGAAWTGSALGNLQMAVTQGADTTVHRVTAAGQYILFLQGTAPVGGRRRGGVF